MKLLTFLTTLLGAISIGAETTSAQSKALRSCPPGWINHYSDMGCLLFHHDSCKDGCAWYQAMEVCQNEGAWLVEVFNQSQQQFLVSMAKVVEVVQGPLDWWIGLTDLGHEGAWRWQHSAKSPTFLPWAINEPNGTTSANCVTMSYGSFNYQWSDVSCGTRQRTFPICQKF